MPQPPKRPQGPRIGPANNAHHWKDWQTRHRAPRPIDLLRKIHNERARELSKERQKAYDEKQPKSLTPEQAKEVDDFGVIETFDENDS
jgi:hypothetical protein